MFILPSADIFGQFKTMGVICYNKLFEWFCGKSIVDPVADPGFDLGAYTF